MLAWYEMFQEIWTSIAKKLYIFVIFQGGGGGPDAMPPSLDPHIVSVKEPISRQTVKDGQFITYNLLGYPLPSHFSVQ